jgi:ubiquinone/menaquinone biosynthesis C-methylase UbiE
MKEKSSDRKLNIGCGEKVLDGYINIDKFQKGENILNIDVEEGLPYENNSIDEILISHCLEHLHKPYDFLLECDRVLKKGGKLNIKLPIFSNVVQHNNFYHNSNYLSILTEKGDIREYKLFNYDLISLKKNGFHILKFIKRCLFRIRDWIYSFIYLEYEFNFIKK